MSDTADLADVVVENVAVSFTIESGVEAVISSHWAATVPSATTQIPRIFNGHKYFS